MNANIFNACLLIGWLLALAGGIWLNPGVGLAAGGLLLIVIAFVVARVAGIYVPQKEGDE
ncbi:TPA: hypothetical protein QDB06_005917 [Burkholderia vietnamiensis]|nr:hypothetical protein C2U71_18785 [Burkholderia ubonensis]HDR9185276.1 hypothetical protein [Burkholderia vietnamiensis]